LDHAQRANGVQTPCPGHTVNAKFISDEQVEICQRRWFSIDDRHLFLSLLMEAACEGTGIVALARTLAPPDQLRYLLYEDFARDPDAELARLFQWMDLDQRALRGRAPSSYVKRTSTNMSTVVANLAEVRGWIREWSSPEAPLEAMLDDIEYKPFGHDQYFLCMHMRSLWFSSAAPPRPMQTPQTPPEPPPPPPPPCTLPSPTPSPPTPLPPTPPPPPPLPHVPVDDVSLLAGGIGLVIGMVLGTIQTAAFVLLQRRLGAARADGAAEVVATYKGLPTSEACGDSAHT